MKDEEKLAALTAQRDRYFASMQSTYEQAKKCDAILLRPDDQTAADRAQLNMFVTRMSQVERNYECYERSLQSIDEVNVKLDEKDRQNTVQPMTAFEELYYFSLEVEERVKEFLKPPPPIANDLNATHATTSHSRNVFNQLKMPRIQIPDFDGKLDEWSNFCGLFTSLIHDESAYSPCEKFHCLKTYLKGEPLDIVSSLQVTDANYYIAWDNLVKRYQNTRLLAGHYINSMLEFRPLTESNVSNLTNFIKVFKTNVNALGALHINRVEDALLLHIAVRNLDIGTRRAFERAFADKDMPSHADLMQFVEEQRAVLQLTSASATAAPSSKPAANSASKKGKAKSFVSTVSKAAPHKCPACSEQHRLFMCAKFKALPISDRVGLIKSHNHCLNCIGNHKLNACKSLTRCQHCSSPHHSTLHEFFKGSTAVSTPGSASLHTSRVLPVERTAHSNTLLSTAIVSILDGHGNPQPVRVLVDQGSMVNIMTQSCCKRLGLKIRRSTSNVTALGGTIKHSDGYVECTLRPSNAEEPSFCTTAFVIPQITDSQPQFQLDPAVKEKFANILLADPHFEKPAPIDFLLGVELFAAIINESCNVIKGEPAAISTCFGWILFGKLPNSPLPAINRVLLTCCQSLDENLKRFWEAESISIPIPPDPENAACEDIFVKTHYRLPSGRYVVKLPFKNRPPSLPDGRQLALKRFTSLETRMIRKPELSGTYHDFMKEYIELSHMVPANSESRYIIPHHTVLKIDSATTKLRTVFDASFKPLPDGPSLNTELMKGAKLQRDLTDILCGFRKFKFVVCADLKMCYRQIIVDPTDRQYQHIFYRSSPDSPVTEYELCTVTYGVKSSSFLSSRVLLQLTKDEGAEFPLASQAIAKQCYVDDICAGAEDLESALQLRHELVELLRRGGFELRKWYSNNSSLLEGIPLEHRNQPLPFLPVDDESVKILGVLYDPFEDVFSYSVEVNSIRLSKRGVFSEISRIFDPLGWLTPTTFSAKCLIQTLWRRGLTWDELLPEDLALLWKNFIEPLPLLRSVKIPRHIPINESKQTRIFGFCDASDKGYAAVVYVTTRRKGKVTSHLLKAKSKVAPLQVQSTPRLELCGAVLLSNMIVSMSDFIEETRPASIDLFCDSTVVLAWLRTPPHLLKTYVANRVVHLLQQTPPHQWHHVRSAINPADPASRGLTATDLIGCDLWWNGPAFILDEFQNDSDPPALEENPLYLTELRPTATKSLLITHSPRHYVELLDHYSTLQQAKRIFAYALRYLRNVRCASADRSVGPLKPEELTQGLFALVRVTQRHHYEKDIDLISKSNPPSSRQLRKLTAFIDDKGILRVGGRIDLAPIPYSGRHPIIIPHKSRLATMIADFYHTNSLHGGTRLMSTLIQRRFWITSLRSVIRKCLIRGKDGAVRVARIQTASGSYIRPVHNLVPLPNVQ